VNRAQEGQAKGDRLTCSEEGYERTRQVRDAEVADVLRILSFGERVLE
jgi:hypothetical protein